MRSLATRTPGGWSAGQDGHGEFVVHEDLRVALRLLPAGSYRIGMSQHEYEAAQRLSPQPNITLSEVTPVIDAIIPTDVLLGDRPISARVAIELGIETPANDLGFPAMLTRDEAVRLAELLGCRLPREAEWETGCRAGSSTLFPWGDELPARHQLDRWLSWEIEDESLLLNPLGLGGLFFGEWCQEPFRVSHAPDADVERNAYVVKGGGAQFWPWQDEEWVWCMPAMRMPSTGLFADGRCAARLALELP